MKTHVTAPLSILFAAKMNDIPEQVIFSASERGKKVHALIAHHLRTHLPLLNEECRGYLNSFMLWKKSTVAEVVAVEEEIEIPEHGIIGTFDAVVRISGDSCLTIVDWKTPATVSPLWRGQLAVYFRGAQRKYPDLERAMTIQLFKDGRCARAVSYETIDEDYAAYISLLYAMRYFLKEV